MFCFLDAESCVLLPESLLNVVDDPGGKGAATLRPHFRMRAGGVGSGAGAPAPAARSAESRSYVPCRAERHAGLRAWSRVGGLIVFPAASASGRSTTVLASRTALASGGVGNSTHISAPPRLRVNRFDARGDAEHAERMLREASAFAGVCNWGAASRIRLRL